MTDARQPLRGLRVLNTRGPGEAEAFSARLRELGARPVSLPTTRILPPDDPAPLDAALDALAAASPAAPAFHWIVFTSARAVEAFMARLAGREGDAALPGVAVAAVGRATADALARYGLAAGHLPPRASGRDLAGSLPDVAGKRILLPRSDVALADLPTLLRERGAAVTELVCYVTRPAAPTPETDEILATRAFDVVAFFSPSAVAGLAALAHGKPLAEALRGAVSACIGGTTAAAAEAAGLRPEIRAADASVDGMVAALAAWAERRRPASPG